MQARRDWIIGVLLFLGTMLLYWPTIRFPFINYDDQIYVYENLHIIKGLSWAGCEWALTANVAANWHPLTLLSHMADCSLYHLFAGGHHLTSFFLHAVNVVLLYVLLKRIMGAWGASLLAAALFAVHPLNVQSVVWIAERKNVLSMFFFLLTLLAYLNYGKNPRPAMYVVTLILFVLGLASKPTLVPLPFLLLLLDYWPLYRLDPQPGLSPGTVTNLHLLLWEKFPFFIFAFADSVATYLYQKSAGSVETLAGTPASMRLVNVPLAYVTYLEKTFFPVKLCLLYAFPEKLPVGPAILAVVFLLGVTAAVFFWRAKFRWVFVGWFWFLGTLVPVIGIVQSGIQSWADRHAYLPLIGIFLIIAYGLDQLCRRRPSWLVLVVVLAAVFVGGCTLLARHQISYWRSNTALWGRAVAINPRNPYAQNLLGLAFNSEDRNDAAIEHFTIAAGLRPDTVDYRYNLGLDLIKAGRFPDAVTNLEAAVQGKPDDAALHNTLGVALVQLNQSAKAGREFTRAIQLQPDYEKPYINLGKVCLDLGRPRDAITNFVTAARLDSNSPVPLQNLAAAYAASGDISNAIATDSRALAMAETNRQPSLEALILKDLNNYKTNAANSASGLPRR